MANNRAVKTGHHFDEVYRINYYAYKQRTLDEFVAAFKDDFDISLPPEENTSGLFIPMQKGSNAIIAIWAADEQYLLHEIIHAIIYVFELRGLPITLDGSEAFTYYFDYLCDKFNQYYKFK